MEYLESLSKLGFPGWFLMVATTILILHYTGALRRIGGFFSAAVSGNQEMMAQLQGKALDQNTLLISFITDRLIDDIESLGEGQKQIVQELGRIREEMRVVVYELNERRSREDGAETIRLIGDLQDRQASLEAQLLESLTREGEDVSQ